MSRHSRFADRLEFGFMILSADCLDDDDERDNLDILDGEQLLILEQDVAMPDEPDD